METFRRRLSEPARQGGEHGFEHRDSELTGIGIEPGAVIAVGQQRAIRQPMQATMCEWEAPATQAERLEHGLVSDNAEREDRAELGRAGYLGSEKAPASRDFTGLGLVLRGHAADRIGDTRPAQHDAVIRTGIVDALREPEFSQRLVQQLASVVAGEWPSRAVCSLQARRKADDQQFRGVIAKRWDRRVKPFRMSRSLDLTKGGKARTERTVARRQSRRC
jgi:hypothetical protein